MLVGDDGQHDPALYGEIADEAPDRVAVVAIRELSPAQQVLSHGAPGPSRQDADRPGRPAQVRGGDGNALALRLIDLGLL